VQGTSDSEQALRAAHGGHAGVSHARGRVTSAATVFTRGIWRENPVLRQMMGLCPALAVTNTVANSLAMGVATFFVLVGSSLLVSTFRRVVAYQVRITSYVLIIATFVTIADMLMEMAVPSIHAALGAFVYLIVVNCMILGRQEAFASNQPVGRALLDAVGTGLGFMLALLLMGGIREAIGYGTLLGWPLFGPSYEPWVVMILPPGGFFTIGVILLIVGWWSQRGATGAATNESMLSTSATRVA
jgi:electron transport complex protein RnfE